MLADSINTESPVPGNLSLCISWSIRFKTCVNTDTAGLDAFFGKIPRINSYLVSESEPATPVKHICRVRMAFKSDHGTTNTTSCEDSDQYGHRSSQIRSSLCP